jgi:23S rRNA (cytosine1962-C5)-methyltransferase
LTFEADLLKGQKTGFFLDQRENRARVEALSRGQQVLNCFAYSGGFSLYAARGGAELVESVDISELALAEARRNFSHNSSNAAVARCRHLTTRADVFEYLKTARKTFGIVILDPPSLAVRESDKAGAIQAYRKLIQSGIGQCGKNGVLVTASCSAHVSREEFFDLARETMRSSKRKFSEIEATTHPPDHPASFKEAEYLKAVFFRLQ